MDAHRIPFSPEDEERIASAGMWGMIVAIASIASSILGTIAAIVQVLRLSGSSSSLPGMGSMKGAMIGAVLVPGLIGVVLTVILGIFLLQASGAFRKVALTDEADQHYLLLGFGKLRNYFMMMGILIFIAIGAFLLLFCGAMTCGAMFRGM